MRISRLICYLLVLCFSLSSAAGKVFAGDLLIERLQEKGILTEQDAKDIEKKQKGIAGIELGATAYIDYSAGKTLDKGKQTSYNKFDLTRGYVTVKKKVNPWLTTRATLDLKQETKTTGADLSESYVTRFKYYYAEFKLPDFDMLTNNKSEVGMGHMPWLDFEEHINPYRCQGTMFQERFGMFSSADLGGSLMGYLGGEMDDEYQKKVSKDYAGQYGSYHIGIYNGGGYHSKEKNNNKVMEYRMTVRPAPDVLPGLQFTYFGLNGDGNQTSTTAGEIPDWNLNTGFVSFQDEYFTLTGEVMSGEGNQKGDWVKTGTTDSRKVDGYSLFGFARIPGAEALRVHARYDVFDPDDSASEDEANLTIVGFSYDIYGKNMIMLNYETCEYEKNHSKVKGGNEDQEEKIQVVCQLNY
ncbi:MAG: hypothetical protein V1753_05195 [Pseudomonadota bacterium]